MASKPEDDAVIITMTNDRTLVWNNDQGWVDRTNAPGATVFKHEHQYLYSLPMGGEWEVHQETDT